MVDVISIGRELLSVIRKAMEIAEQRKQNNSILEELQRFYQDLDVNIGHLQEKALCSNSAKWALDALQKDLKYALGEAGKILKKGFLRSLWNANKIQTRIQGLRERVMTSFQTRLSIASLDVALESKHDQDAFRAAMLNVNNELQAMYISTSASLKQELQLALRRQLGELLRTIMSAMESQSNKIDGAASMISSIEPQTSDAEKFREDVLAALNVLSARDAATQYDAKRGASSSTALKWFQDPVTWETMCDPVKATDGHTYDRWTILGKPNIHAGLRKSPFTPHDPHPFRIAEDDIDVRSRLFRKFPDSEVEFQKCRAKYKETALQKVKLKHFGDAALMLAHVLEWAPRDAECIRRLEYVQKIISGDGNDSANSSAAAADIDAANYSTRAEWGGSSVHVAGQEWWQELLWK